MLCLLKKKTVGSCPQLEFKSRVEFKPIQLAQLLSNDAALQAKLKLSSFNKTPEESPDLFLKFYLAAGGVIFLDMDPRIRYGNTKNAVEVSPVLLDQRVVFDHHGGYRHHKNDSTQQVIDFILNAMKTSDRSKKLIELQEQFQVVSTDNLGDASLAIWVLNYLSDIVQCPDFLNFIRTLTEYEDFGVFGKFEEENARLKKDTHQLNAIEAAQSLLHEYEKLIKKYHLTSDRFDSLSVLLQKKIFYEIQKSIYDLFMLVQNQGIENKSFHLEGSTQFRKNRENSLKYVKLAHQKAIHAFTRELKKYNPDRENIRELVLRMNRGFYVWNEAEIPVSVFGFFNTPSAGYQLDSDRVQVKYLLKKNEKLTFVIAYSYPFLSIKNKIRLDLLEKEFGAAHLSNSRKYILSHLEPENVTPDHIESLMREEERALTYQLIARETLVASFSGLKINLAEFARILAKFSN